jgi:predicted DCC family thiol-disulfide oxidoreductase YuxK
MKRLYVLYDSNCGLCTRIKFWLVRQPAYIAIHPIPLGSPQAVRLFPGLFPAPAQSAKSGELVVIGDNGGVYFGDHAWIMCLYALREYRATAKRLSTPTLQPLAREAFAFISRYRYSISRWLGTIPEAEMNIMLKDVITPRCVS